MALTAILTASPVSSLRMEYEYHQSLYGIQPVMVRHFLDQQARLIAQAILDNAARLRFSLPNRVMPAGEAEALNIPAGQREQFAGRRIAFGTPGLCSNIVRHLVGLERSPDTGVALSGSLLRFAVAHSMVHQMLPDGRSVHYRLPDGDEIPSELIDFASTPKSAISAKEDALTQAATPEAGRGELQVPYPPSAQRFFLPQWVAFDEKNNMLTNTLEEAGAYIHSMRTFLSVLHRAVTVAPYMAADETYQRKRSGILGQLVNQGRALACYEARETIKRIKYRAEEGSLNRGLSLSLSYFDDQALTIKLYEMQIIPAGRVMFISAFIVLAVRNEYVRIARDTRLNSSTRKHLLSLLAMLEKAFLVQPSLTG